ncbi:10721_t:CDS:2, partial [Cetraspora pellucida]
MHQRSYQGSCGYQKGSIISDVESQDTNCEELVKDLLSIVTMFTVKHNDAQDSFVSQYGTASNLEEMNGHVKMDLQSESEDLQVRNKEPT